MFGKTGRKSNWKADYEDTIYKIYDWDSNLAGYFYPQYDTTGLEMKEEDEATDAAIEEMNKSHHVVPISILLLPMTKLDLLDREDGIDLEYVLGSLDANLQRVQAWKEWIGRNSRQFGITGDIVYTAREDRNMLSIGLRLDTKITLGEKEIMITLSPLLDRLHEDGLL